MFDSDNNKFYYKKKIPIITIVALYEIRIINSKFVAASQFPTPAPGTAPLRGAGSSILLLME